MVMVAAAVGGAFAAVHYPEIINPVVIGLMIFSLLDRLIAR
ncbi:hypothetical protein ACI2K4_33335 [Micromonospora sp. NPDC050397]